MAKGNALPDEDHVARWIKPRLLGRDDDGNVLVDGAGRPAVVFPQAFELRPTEDGLSVTWLEVFGPNLQEQLPAAAEAVRSSTDSGTLQSQSAFAIGNVGQIRAAGQANGAKFRILEDPEPENPGHSEIRRYLRDSALLFQQMANSVFGLRYLYKEIRKNGWAP